MRNRRRRKRNRRKAPCFLFICLIWSGYAKSPSDTSGMIVLSQEDRELIVCYEECKALKKIAAGSAYSKHLRF